MRSVLARKQIVLIRQLNSQIKRITKCMKEEGISSHDIQLFIATSIFQCQTTQKVPSNKHSKDICSETEEETNSQSSQYRAQMFQISLEKAITNQIDLGLTLDRILLRYIQNSYVQQQKFRNYLEAQEASYCRKTESFDIQSFKLNLQKNQFLQNTHRSIQDFILPKNQLHLTRLSSIKKSYLESKKLQIKESQKQLDQIRSFQRSLSESIKKTRMLRNMLQKQFSSTFSLANQI